MAKKILLTICISLTMALAGESNRATLDDIKEATVLLIKQSKEDSQSLDALKSRIAMAEKNVKDIKLDEAKIKQNLYLAPHPSDVALSEFLNKNTTNIQK